MELKISFFAYYYDNNSKNYTKDDGKNYTKDDGKNYNTSSKNKSPKTLFPDYSYPNSSPNLYPNYFYSSSSSNNSNISTISSSNIIENSSLENTNTLQNNHIFIDSNSSNLQCGSVHFNESILKFFHVLLLKYPISLINTNTNIPYCINEYNEKQCFSINDLLNFNYTIGDCIYIESSNSLNILNDEESSLFIKYNQLKEYKLFYDFIKKLNEYHLDFQIVNLLILFTIDDNRDRFIIDNSKTFYQYKLFLPKKKLYNDYFEEENYIEFISTVNIENIGILLNELKEFINSENTIEIDFKEWFIKEMFKIENSL